MITLDEIIKKLKDIKEQGYIKTHRSGNTGVGKTLEDLLGIDENNIPSSNCVTFELKSARKNSSSMLTLLTKAPAPSKANSVLLEKFGYKSKRGNNRLELHTTANGVNFNRLKGNQGFKIALQEDRVNLITPQMEVVGYWDSDMLRKSFERKLPGLLYVKAEAKNKGREEKFWYCEAWLLSGFNFESFTNLLKEGVILVDIRIGQYPNGRTHDHGTAFRVLPDKLDLCFARRERVM